jgi:hypothetical protein
MTRGITLETDKEDRKRTFGDREKECGNKAG